MSNELLCIESGMHSCTNDSLKFWETLINLPIGRIWDAVIWCDEDWNPNAAEWQEKY